MVEMRVNDFLANLKGGGARPNLFQVDFSFPTFALETGEESRVMSIMCKSAQLPSSTLGIIEIPFRGRQVKIPGDRTFEEWTITVLNNTDFQIRNAFERWSNAINEHRANIGISNPSELMTNAKVHQINHQGEIIKSYDMVGMFPSEVSAIELSYESTDEVEEFTVTLQYQFWESNTTS